MNLKNIFYAIDNYYDSTYEALEYLDSLCSDIRGRPKQLVSELEELIEEIALENELCPCCFTKLEHKEICNEVVEFQGFPVQESIIKLYCNECNWSNE